MRIGYPITVYLFLDAPFYLLSTSLGERLSEAVLDVFWPPKLLETIRGAFRAPPDLVSHIDLSEKVLKNATLEVQNCRKLIYCEHLGPLQNWFFI